MLNLQENSLDNAYKVLEIEPTATDDEVRAAYRRMAIKHHPDKVANLGEDYARPPMRNSKRSMRLRSVSIKREA